MGAAIRGPCLHEPTLTFTTEIMREWPAFAPRWVAMTRAGPVASPFQTAHWLGCWYGAFPGATGVQPLLVAVRDATSGEDVLLLPLIVREAGGLRTIEFADLDVTDCNAPAFLGRLGDDPAAARAACLAIRGALPRCDAVRWTKMPPLIGGRANPLLQFGATATCAVQDWLLGIEGTWAAYLGSLDRHARKELGRSLRLCEKIGATRLIVARTPEEAHRILAFVDDQQRERLSASNVRHVFDRPGTRQFYVDMAAAGVANADSIVAGLEIAGDIVAGVVGVLAKPRVTVLRIANRGGDMARLGLGRLILEQTFKALHADGFSQFDLSIGDGEHKRRLGASPEPLLDIDEPMSWLGQLVHGARRSKALVKARAPRLAALLRRMRDAASAPPLPRD